MVQKNKYWKTLAGFFFESIVAKATAYTDDTTYEDFVANAAEGEIGIFDANTYDALSGALTGSPAAVVPASSSQYLFVAMKRDGLIEKTNKFQLAAYTAKRIAYAAAVAQVSDVKTTGTPAAGKYYSIKVIETTVGSQPYPSWEYGYVAKSSDTLTTIATAIAALVNDKTNVINKDTDSVVTAAVVNTDDIRLTATGGATFRIALSEDAYDLGWAADYTESGTAAPSQGSGTYAQVAELEEQALIYKGVTTNYPKDGTVPSEYGKPTAFAASGVNYNIYFISGLKYESSPTPLESHRQPHNIILAIPTSGGPEVAVKGILGL